MHVPPAMHPIIIDVAHDLAYTLSSDIVPIVWQRITERLLAYFTYRGLWNNPTLSEFPPNRFQVQVSMSATVLQAKRLLHFVEINIFVPVPRNRSGSKFVVNTTSRDYNLICIILRQRNRLRTWSRFWPTIRWLQVTFQTLHYMTTGNWSATFSIHYGTFWALRKEDCVSISD